MVGVIREGSVKKVASLQGFESGLGFRQTYVGGESMGGELILGVPEANMLSVHPVYSRLSSHGRSLQNRSGRGGYGERKEGLKCQIAR